jgi:hypothetical protein
MRQETKMFINRNKMLSSWDSSSAQKVLVKDTPVLPHHYVILAIPNPVRLPVQRAAFVPITRDKNFILAKVILSSSFTL